MPELMTKICFPHHLRGEFSSLDEAFRFLRKREYGWSWNTLTEIVRYNVFYRDYLRDYGMDSLIEKIIDEVPELSNDRKALDYLREWADTETVAPYDIQCQASGACRQGIVYGLRELCSGGSRHIL